MIKLSFSTFVLGLVCTVNWEDNGLCDGILQRASVGFLGQLSVGSLYTSSPSIIRRTGNAFVHNNRLDSSSWNQQAVHCYHKSYVPAVRNPRCAMMALGGGNERRVGGTAGDDDFNNPTAFEGDDFGSIGMPDIDEEARRVMDQLDERLIAAVDSGARNFDDGFDLLQNEDTPRKGVSGFRKKKNMKSGPQDKSKVAWSAKSITGATKDETDLLDDIVEEFLGPGAARLQRKPQNRLDLYEAQKADKMSRTSATLDAAASDTISAAAIAGNVTELVPSAAAVDAPSLPPVAVAAAADPDAGAGGADGAWTLQRELQDVLLEAGAPRTAAEAVAALVPDGGFGGEWRGLLAALRAAGANGASLCEMLSRVPSILLLAPARVPALVEFLRGELGMDTKGVRYVLGRRPSLLAVGVEGPGGVRATAATLCTLGLSRKQLRITATTSPGVLAVGAARVRAFGAAVCGRGGVMEPQEMGSLLRRAPWVVLFDPEEEVAPMLAALTAMGVADLAQVIRAYPQVLGLSVERQAMRVHEELVSLGIHPGDVARMIELCPAILGASLPAQLRPLLHLLLHDLDIPAPAACVALRAFPATLLLSIEGAVRPAVQFLRDLGLRNVGRVVTRLPPLLGMDVATELVPKMRFLDKVGLTVYDLGQFPPYFSFPLDTIIRPRLLYMLYKGVPLTSKPLKYILAPTDSDFCAITLAPVGELQEYKRFVAALPPIRIPEASKKGKLADPEPVLAVPSHDRLHLQLKGDSRVPGYKRHVDSLKQLEVREVWDAEKDQWVLEGGDTPPTQTTSPGPDAAPTAPLPPFPAAAGTSQLFGRPGPAGDGHG